MSATARIRVIAGLAACSIAGAAQAQVFSNEEPITTVQPQAALEHRPKAVSFDALDLAWLHEVEAQRQAQGLIRHFAVPSDVDYSPRNSGEITFHGDGMVSWRLRINSKNAKNINLGLKWDQVPESTFMLLSDGNGEPAYEPFLSDLNNPNGIIFTPPVSGSAMEVYVEVDEAEWDKFLESFAITRISLGFLDFGEAIGTTLRSNACHTDVACPEGDPWTSQISSVGAYTINGFGTCSGALMNNTAEDGTPYFMSANHCGIQNNPASVVVFWNFQQSFCRTPGSPQSGGPGNGPTNQFTQGSQFRMTHQPADFSLVELNSVPNPSFNVDYAGWDNRNVAPPSGLGIHHPNVEEKRIAFENSPFGQQVISIGGPGIFSWAINYDIGGLEGGSSGSPLYNNIGRVVGTGTAVNTFTVICGPGQSQFYGRLDVAWDNGSASNSLVSWLDPLGTGQDTLDPLNFDPPLLSNFDLLAPTNGATEVLVQPTIDWDASTNADEYHVLVDDDMNFLSPEVDATVPAPTTQFTPGPGVLLEDTVYFCKVEAINFIETKDSNQGTISFTTMLDCNGNLIHDPNELATNDCNSNGIPDDCDIVPAPVLEQSAQLSPIGFGANQSFNINPARPAVNNVTLDFNAQGDLEAASEAVSIFLNSTFQGQVFQSATECPTITVDTDQLIIPAATWNNAVTSGAGSVTIDMNPTSQVSAGQCLSGSFIQIEVSYDGAPFSLDNDMNGVPDECSVACSPADITTTGAGAGDPGFGVPDGFVTSADLNFFVNAWVALDTAVADVTTTGAGAGDPGFGVPDGNVTAADLNFYINIWIQGCP